MLVLTCTTNTNPCPPGEQVWKTTEEVADPAAFGLTADTVMKVYAWGFSAVLACFLLGYFASLALAVIRKA